LCELTTATAAKLLVAAVLHPAAATGLLAAGLIATIGGTFFDAVQSSSWSLFAPAATSATATAAATRVRLDSSSQEMSSFVVYGGP
jgi:hypothetical protein